MDTKQLYIGNPKEGIYPIVQDTVTVIELNEAVMNLTSDSTSEEIIAAFGTVEDFNSLIEQTRDTENIVTGILMNNDNSVGKIICSIAAYKNQYSCDIEYFYSGNIIRLAITNTDGTMTCVRTDTEIGSGDNNSIYVLDYANITADTVTELKDAINNEIPIYLKNGVNYYLVLRTSIQNNMVYICWGAFMSDSITIPHDDTPYNKDICYFDSYYLKLKADGSKELIRGAAYKRTYFGANLDSFLNGIVYEYNFSNRNLKSLIIYISEWGDKGYPVIFDNIDFYDPNVKSVFTTVGRSPEGDNYIFTLEIEDNTAKVYAYKNDTNNNIVLISDSIINTINSYVEGTYEVDNSIQSELFSGKYLFITDSNKIAYIPIQINNNSDEINGIVVQDRGTSGNYALVKYRIYLNEEYVEDGRQMFIELKHLGIKDDGDGTKFLSDNGEYKEIDAVSADNVLTKTNTTEYTPSADYNPATKKYVDDSNVFASDSGKIDFDYTMGGDGFISSINYVVNVNKNYNDFIVTFNLTDTNNNNIYSRSYINQITPDTSNVVNTININITIHDDDTTNYKNILLNVIIKGNINYNINENTVEFQLKSCTPICKQVVLSESKYSNLTDTSNDNVLYFITPD